MSFVHFRASVWLVLPCLVLSSSCCTLAGAGIGYAIPRRGDEMPADIRAVAPGTAVSVVYRGVERAGADTFSTVDGLYRGMDNDRAIVEDGYRAYSIPFSRIEQTQARPTLGSYSLEGGLIGLGLDVAIFFGMLYIASQWVDQPGDI